LIENQSKSHHIYDKFLDGIDAADNKNSKNLNYIFLNPAEKRHDTNLLKGVNMPESMININMFEQMDRKFYMGSRVLRMLERALGISNDSNELYNRGLNDKNEYQV